MDIYGNLEFNPDKEVPDWFWPTINKGNGSVDVFREIIKEMDHDTFRQLIRTMFDLAGFFEDGKFFPPPHIASSTNSLLDAGHWVVSQGKEYFMTIWDNPKLFWELVDNDIPYIERAKNLIEVASSVWWDRFPDEELPFQ